MPWPPADRVGIFTTSGQLTLDIATARNQVLQTVNRVLNVGEAENRDTYRQLEGVLWILSAKHGMRILLFASPGFPLARLNLEASQIVEHANRANIATNAIDARGLYAPEVGGNISQPSTDLPSAVGIKASLRLAEQNDQQSSLMWPLGSYRVVVVFSAGGKHFGKFETPIQIVLYLGKTITLGGVVLSTNFQKLDQGSNPLDAMLAEDRTPRPLPA
jgi:hypothetical protein